MGDLVVMMKPVFTLEERKMLKEFPVELGDLEHEEEIRIVSVQDFASKLKVKEPTGEGEYPIELEIIDSNG